MAPRRSSRLLSCTRCPCDAFNVWPLLKSPGELTAATLCMCIHALEKHNLPTDAPLRYGTLIDGCCCFLNSDPAAWKHPESHCERCRLPMVSHPNVFHGVELLPPPTSSSRRSPRPSYLAEGDTVASHLNRQSESLRPKPLVSDDGSENLIRDCIASSSTPQKKVQEQAVPLILGRTAATSATQPQIYDRKGKARETGVQRRASGSDHPHRKRRSEMSPAPDVSAARPAKKKRTLDVQPSRKGKETPSRRRSPSLQGADDPAALSDAERSVYDFDLTTDPPKAVSSIQVTPLERDLAMKATSPRELQVCMSKRLRRDGDFVPNIRALVLRVDWRDEVTSLFPTLPEDPLHVQLEHVIQREDVFKAVIRPGFDHLRAIEDLAHSIWQRLFSAVLEVSLTDECEAYESVPEIFELVQRLTVNNFVVYVIEKESKRTNLKNQILSLGVAPGYDTLKVASELWFQLELGEDSALDTVDGYVGIKIVKEDKQYFCAWFVYGVFCALYISHTGGAPPKLGLFLLYLALVRNLNDGADAMFDRSFLAEGHPVTALRMYKWIVLGSDGDAEVFADDLAAVGHHHWKTPRSPEEHERLLNDMAEYWTLGCKGALSSYQLEAFRRGFNFNGMAEAWRSACGNLKALAWTLRSGSNVDPEYFLKHKLLINKSDSSIPNSDAAYVDMRAAIERYTTTYGHVDLPEDVAECHILDEEDDSFGYLRSMYQLCGIDEQIREALASRPGVRCMWLTRMAFGKDRLGDDDRILLSLTISDKDKPPIDPTLGKGRNGEPLHSSPFRVHGCSGDVDLHCGPTLIDSARDDPEAFDRRFHSMLLYPHPDYNFA